MWALFPFPPTCEFLHVNLLTTYRIFMKIYILTNKTTTNIFGLHAQPRKTTRYTKKNEARVRWGEKEKEPVYGPKIRKQGSAKNGSYASRRRTKCVPS